MKSKPSIRKALPLLLGGLALSGLAHGQVSITTAFGNGADTWLDNDDPAKNGSSATNFGSAGSMEVRNFTGVRMRYSLVRFDISSLDAGSDNSDGTISLAQTYGANRGRDWNVYLLRDGYDNSGVDPNKTENWDESTVSYDSTPGITGAGTDDAPAFDTDLDIYDATTNPSGAWELIHTETGWSVAGIGGGPATMPILATTTAIEDAITADTDGQLTFLLITRFSDNGNNYGLATKESTELPTHYPTLVLPNGTSGDSDGDGLPAAWEIANGLNDNDDGTIGESSPGLKDGPNGALGDPDNDTHNNLAEFNAGSDPKNVLSVPTDIDADGLLDLWEDQHFGDNSGSVELADVAPQDGLGDPDNDKGTNEDEETAATDPNSRTSFLDNDGGSPDGLNDWWEAFYFGNTSTATNPAGNNDGDAFSNQQEYDAFSDPFVATSVPGDIDGDGMPDLWEDRYYGNNDGIVNDSVAGLAELAIADGTANTDGDAFTDLEESNSLPIGSDPFDANSVPGDSDADNLGDQWELDNFGDVTSNNGLHDPDGDLYTNDEEEAAGTDPNDILDFVDDTEPDGQNDRWENLYFGNLSTSTRDDDDIDNDGFLNFEEYEAFSNPNNINSTPDDIDGDGLEDTFEVTFFGDIYTYDGDDDPDRDYSTNKEEEVALTDPTNRAISPDTDNGGAGDGLGDGWEMFSFGNLTSTDDPVGDNDSDGSNNAAEYAAATNGNDALSTPDSDNDGLPDGWELFHFIMSGEDPVADRVAILARQTGKNDTDNGGASNQLEFYAGTDPNDAGVDDPNPATVTTANGNGADAVLVNDQLAGPGTVNSAGNGLEFRYNAASRLRLGLLRFDVNGLSGDLSSTLLRINMTGTPRTRDLTIYGLVDGEPGENWPEATTSYSNAPGLIASELDQLNVFARDPKKLRRLGVLSIQQNVTGIYLSNPNTLDLKSFIESDTDGLITLCIFESSASNESFTATSKEGAANEMNMDLAPALVAPNATFAVPTVLTISSVSFDAGANTFTMSVEGLASGASYHVESMVPPATVFTAVGGSTFTAGTDPQDVVITADEATNPTQLFRISDGAEP